MVLDKISLCFVTDNTALFLFFWENHKLKNEQNCPLTIVLKKNKFLQIETLLAERGIVQQTIIRNATLKLPFTSGLCVA